MIQMSYTKQEGNNLTLLFPDSASKQCVQKETVSASHSLLFAATNQCVRKENNVNN